MLERSRSLAAEHRPAVSRRRRRYVPLFHRVAATNALLLVTACLVTILVLSPRHVSSFAADEAGVLVGALALVALVNLYVLRRVVGPLQQLTALARHVDLTHPGQRMPTAAPTSEAGELALTFNQMLERLEQERRQSTGLVLAAQEAERLRIAQELHDQVGQTLTAVLLQLSRIHARVPAELRPEVDEVQDAARASLEDVRRIAIELRPEALDDLGLSSALAVLADGFAQRSGLRVIRRIREDLPPLSPEAELVVYRVAQEALTNVARHAETDRAELTLATSNGRLTLIVSDEGRGLGDDHADGTGVRGMRERAALIGAELQITRDPSTGGTRVRLDIAQEPAS
jgi:two-component system, NarL family, sensor histidine kinase UhpB